MNGIVICKELFGVCAKRLTAAVFAFCFVFFLTPSCFRTDYSRYHPTAKVPKTGAVDAHGLTGRKRLSDGEALRRQHRFVRDPAEDTLAQEVGTPSRRMKPERVTAEKQFCWPEIPDKGDTMSGETWSNFAARPFCLNPSACGT